MARTLRRLNTRYVAPITLFACGNLTILALTFRDSSLYYYYWLLGILQQNIFEINFLGVLGSLFPIYVLAYITSNLCSTTLSRGILSIIRLSGRTSICRYIIFELIYITIIYSFVELGTVILLDLVRGISTISSFSIDFIIVSGITRFISLTFIVLICNNLNLLLKTNIACFAYLVLLTILIFAAMINSHILFFFPGAMLAHDLSQTSATIGSNPNVIELILAGISGITASVVGTIVMIVTTLSAIKRYEFC